MNIDFHFLGYILMFRPRDSLMLLRSKAAMSKSQSETNCQKNFKNLFNHKHYCWSVPIEKVSWYCDDDYFWRLWQCWRWGGERCRGPDQVQCGGQCLSQGQDPSNSTTSFYQNPCKVITILLIFVMINNISDEIWGVRTESCGLRCDGPNWSEVCFQVNVSIYLNYDACPTSMI